MSRRVRPRLWRYIIPVLTLVAGGLFAAGANTSRGTDLRSSRTRVTDLITAEQRGYLISRQDYLRTRAEVEALNRQAGRRDAHVLAAQRAANTLAASSGFTPLTGSAVRVTLNDAPRGRRFPGDPSPDDLVVHQQDVQAVVNALWAGGAAGLQIMDQRVISTSAVRCVGNTLILQGVVYSPPFQVIAVGDPRRLHEALDASPEIQIYQQYVAEYGLGYTVKDLEKTTLPGYTGSVTTKYAETLGADSHP